MHKRIKTAVSKRIATADKNAIYVCGNSDYVIVFDFDEEWSASDTKTARFTYDGRHQDVIFDGNECPVPIISNAYGFKVGVFAGNLKTTTPAYVPARKSILCEGGLPASPPDDVYAQMMKKINEIAEQGVTDEQIYDAVDAYLTDNPIDTGVDFITDETLSLQDGILSVNTAEKVERDNTLPVTSAAVFTEVGNINALLETI